jgi:hypothetical protein
MVILTHDVLPKDVEANSVIVYLENLEPDGSPSRGESRVASDDEEETRP